MLFPGSSLQILQPMEIACDNALNILKKIRTAGFPA